MLSLKPLNGIRFAEEFSRHKFALWTVAASAMAGVATPSEALAAKLGIALEPLAGYEQVQKLLPSQHTTTRFFYGARLRAGLPLVSAEAEYTRANDTEAFPGSSMSTQDDRLKVGLVSSIGLGKLIRMLARAGVQGQQSTVTTDGVTTVYPIEYKPYAGAGLSVALGKQIQGNAGVTVVFRQWPDMSRNDYQATAGFTIRFGTSDL